MPSETVEEMIPQGERQIKRKGGQSDSRLKDECGRGAQDNSEVDS